MTVLPPTSVAHSEIIAFFERILVPSLGAKEVSFFYHTPRKYGYQPSQKCTNSVVLSITPTPGFYRAAKASRDGVPPVCFLHRPWSLDRLALQRNILVLASHASFDEHLTVGWNVALAQRLSLDPDQAVCIKGYKENPDRKIGLVAKFDQPVDVDRLQDRLKEEYQGAGVLYDPGVEPLDGGVLISKPKIRVLAIMNAFHAEEIERVLSAARDKGWIGAEDDGRSVLYLTGAARDYGLEAAKQVNMPVFCVGHRECEEWGVRYLATELRKQWPLLNVVEVLEEEEPVPKKTKPTPEETLPSV